MSTLHPIMKDYLSSSESLDRIVLRHYDKNNFLETVWAQLIDEIHQKSMNQSLLESIDKAIVKGHPDQNIFMLFIAIALSYNNAFMQFEKSHSLCSIALSLKQEKIQPIVRALFLQHYANLLRKEGKVSECMKLMDESVSLISSNDPRYSVILNNTFFMIAVQGKLKENGVYKLDSLQWASKEDQFLYLTELKIENSILIGDYEEGLALLNSYKAYSQIELAPRFTDYTNLLQIISGELSEANYKEQEYKDLAKSLQLLLFGKVEESKKIFGKLMESSIKKTLFRIVTYYMPVNFEITLGNKGMAKLLLQEKEKKGDVSYMDDFFYGRLYLIENDLVAAEKSFVRLQENVSRFGAKNRLIYEMQFAKELSLANQLQLLNGWKSIARTEPYKEKVAILKEVSSKEKGIKLLIGKSKGIKNVKDLVKKYAKLKVPVLVTGETGTGKDLVARAIHDEGVYPEEPFLAINCGALTDSLLQSELFGYEAGAFTGAQKQRKGIFEAAGKGTVFLDEFGDISPKLQVSLLRVFELNEIRLLGGTSTRKIQCKIVIATNVDLHIAVAEKRFREDLYFRLAKFEIRMPSLREKKEDLPELIQYFLDKNCHPHENKMISNGLILKLMEYHWPGNIRELKNEIDRLYILNPDTTYLDVEHFDFSHLQIKAKSGQNSQNIQASLNVKIADNPLDEDLSIILRNGLSFERRIELIKEMFKKYRKMTRNQIMEVSNISSTTATKCLKSLVNSGFIIRRTPTKSTRTDYFEFVENNSISNSLAKQP